MVQIIAPTPCPYNSLAAEEPDLKLRTRKAGGRAQEGGGGGTGHRNPCSGILTFSVISGMLKPFSLKVICYLHNQKIKIKT